MICGMPLSVTKLQAKVAEVTIIFGEDGEENPDTVTLKYHPGQLTPALEADINTLRADEGRAQSYCEHFSALIVRDADGVPQWDVLDDTDKSKPPRPYPTDPESLMLLGWDALVAIMNGIWADFQPTKSRIAGAEPVAQDRRKIRRVS
jgi:hypothetical protein